jgi:replicative DNA helicase
MADLVLQHAKDAEAAILGGILDGVDMIDLAALDLSPDLFWWRPHRKLWELLASMLRTGIPIDLVSVASEIRKGSTEEGADVGGSYGGIGYVLDLPTKCPSTSNLGYYVSLLRKALTARRVAEAIELAQERLQEGIAEPGDVAASAASSLAGIASGAVAKGAGMQPVSAFAGEVWAGLERIADKEEAPAFPTGFPLLDRKLGGGIKPGDLVIIAGRPAMGKTCLSDQIAEHIAGPTGRVAAAFHLEMARGELLVRSVSRRVLVPGLRIRTGELSLNERARVRDSFASIGSELRLYVDDTPGLSIGQLQARLRALKLQHPELTVAVVDYLQLMTGEDRKDPRQQQVADISRGLKLIAKELQIGVIAVSQLNRDCEDRIDKRPVASDLRESGAIEQDADVIMLVYRREFYFPRDEKSQGKAEVILAKVRAGAPGTIELRFDGPTYRFIDDTASVGEELFG